MGGGGALIGREATRPTMFLPTPEAWESWNSASSGRAPSGADTFGPACLCLSWLRASLGFLKRILSVQT